MCATERPVLGVLSFARVPKILLPVLLCAPSQPANLSYSVVASDSLVLKISRDAHVGELWFETVIAGTEWDQVLFTKILKDCEPKLQQTLDNSSTSNEVLLGTLLPHLQHDSIIVCGSSQSRAGGGRGSSAYESIVPASASSSVSASTPSVQHISTFRSRSAASLLLFYGSQEYQSISGISKQVWVLFQSRPEAIQAEIF